MSGGRGPWRPNWPLPDEQLQAIMGRPGELPTPGNDRWGNSKLLQPQPKPKSSFTFVNVGMGPIITPMALEISFSIDGVTFTPQVPLTYANQVAVVITKAVDIKSGAFTETTILNPGEGLPFCTLIARALTVTVSIFGESAGELFVHCAACPTQTVDCESIASPANAAWNDVDTTKFAADTVGAFSALVASPSTKQVIIQNDTATDLLIGFGSLIPGLGPPPTANIVLPGGFHGVWESFPGAMVGAVHGIFAAGGSATEFATFTRGIAV